MQKLEFGTIDYWQDGIEKCKDRIQNLTSQIDELECEAYDLKQQKEESLVELKDYQDEIKSIQMREEAELHEKRMRTDMVYHAMHTPSQQRLF